jgi:hypothetical protein
MNMRIANRESRIAAATLAMLAAVGVTLGARATDEKPADVSGRWLMRETYPDYTGQLRETWMEVAQDGPHVTVRAWEAHDAWTCTGRGRVEGNRLDLRWWGRDKYWRGTAALELVGGELRGTFRREDVEGAATQYCRGWRFAE